MAKADTNAGGSVGRFQFRDVAVAYHTIGKGPPLLLLHGWGSRATVMLPLAKALADIRTCYVPDLPGFGETPPPGEPWSVDDYKEFVRTFSENAIGVPTDVLAHSFGGRMTLKWAAESGSGDKLKKILITGGAGMKPRRTPSFYFRKSAAFILKAPFLLLPAALKEKALAWLRKTAVWKQLGSSDYQKLEGVMRETFVRTVSEHLEPCLPHISQEVLLLWGKEDAATPWYQAERMEKGLKNGALVGIEGAGHYAFLDQPVRFLRIARAFFAAKG